LVIPTIVDDIRCGAIAASLIPRSTLAPSHTSSGIKCIPEIVLWLLNRAYSVSILLQVTNSASIRGIMSSALLSEAFRHCDDADTRYHAAPSCTSRERKVRFERSSVLIMLVRWPDHTTSFVQSLSWFFSRPECDCSLDHRCVTINSYGEGFSCDYSSHHPPPRRDLHQLDLSNSPSAQEL